MNGFRKFRFRLCSSSPDQGRIRDPLSLQNVSANNSVLHVSGPIFESSQSIFYDYRKPKRSFSVASRSRRRLHKLFCWACNSTNNRDWTDWGQDFDDDVLVLPGKGAGKGRACCCGTGVDADIESLPDSCMDQDETTVQYKVEFPNPFLDQTSWSIGIADKQFLWIRVVLRAPDIWVGHIKLKEPLEETKFFADYENDYKKCIITIMKPSDSVWRTIGVKQPNHNKVMNSMEAEPDFYSASIILKEELTENHYLFAIHTNAEYQFGVPVAWHMLIKIDNDVKPYSPIQFITAKQAHEYARLDSGAIKGIGQITYFIIKIWPEGQMTSKLNELALNHHGALQIGGILGQFDTTWLFETDRLIIMAGGSGVSPWISVIKYCADRMDDILVRQVVFIYSCKAKTVDNMIWHQVWESMATLDWFFYVPYATSEAEESTRFTPETIVADFEQIPEPTGAVKPMIIKGMCCGPNGFNEACLSVFETLGITEENITLFGG